MFIMVLNKNWVSFKWNTRLVYSLNHSLTVLSILQGCFKVICKCDIPFWMESSAQTQLTVLSVSGLVQCIWCALVIPIPHSISSFPTIPPLVPIIISYLPHNSMSYLQSPDSAAHRPMCMGSIHWSLGNLPVPTCPPQVTVFLTIYLLVAVISSVRGR